MKKLVPFCLILSVFATHLQAQQYPLFTNFWTNSLGYNPAEAGLKDGFEAKFTNRTQWTGIKKAPLTQLATVQGKSPKLPFGFGGYFYNDRSARFERKGATGILAYSQPLSKSTAISFGAAFGYYKYALQAGYNATDPNDPSLAIAEKGKWAMDMNVGLMLTAGNAWVGISSPQFLQKIVNFNLNQDAESQNEIVRHYYLSAGYRHYMGKKFLQPGVLMKYVANAPFQWDLALKYGTGTPLWVGASYRSNAAATAMVGIDYQRFMFSYGYDITTSGLNTVSKGTHEITVGYIMGKCKDKDGDGICDNKDKCPEEPGTAEKDGCPDDKKKGECRDRDKDGVCDEEDECPELFGLKEKKGCPGDDRDKDGVPDAEDKCPDVPGFKQYQGCPMNDRDGDGLRDDLDKCPDEPGPVNNLGCPLSANDSDGDGVVDAVDKCPNTPGTKENDGCPKLNEEDKRTMEVAIDKLYFDTDKWIIKPASKPHLDKLAQVLKDRKEWKIRIAGHADQRGTEQHNLNLSKNRAEATMYYLMSKGVKREQMVVEYYGEYVPESKRKDESGYSKNRRVEMEYIFN